MNKFFRTCRDYEMAYRSGCKGKEVEATVKLYKSRRRVYNTDKYSMLQKKALRYIREMFGTVRIRVLSHVTVFAEHHVFVFVNDQVSPCHTLQLSMTETSSRNARLCLGLATCGCLTPKHELDFSVREGSRLWDEPLAI